MTPKKLFLNNNKYDKMIIDVLSNNHEALENIAIGYKSKDFKKVFKWYKIAADNGSNTAMYNIGLFYKNGEGVNKNIDLALHWFKRAAYLGNIEAIYNLIDYYENIDSMKALEWYYLGASFDDDKLMFHIGNFYYYGYERKLFNESLKLETKSNSVDSCDKNIIISKDINQAVRWYNKAADKGNTNAMLHIGILHAKGFFGKENYQEAIKWFKKSADGDNSNARAALAYCYENGYGC
jgi:tetratricopeptide (TPR) repeat protein